MFRHRRQVGTKARTNKELVIDKRKKMKKKKKKTHEQ